MIDNCDSNGNWQRVARPAEGEATCFALTATMKLGSGETVDINEQGFVVCFQGELRAWRNHCPHAGSPLDWIPGQFFSSDGQQLICHTHHAVFDPLSGTCLAGPCPRGLYPLQIREKDASAGEHGVSGMIEVPCNIGNIG